MQKDRGLYYIVKILQLLSSSTDLPTEKAKSLIPLLGVDRQRDSEIEVKEGLVKLDKDSCRNTEYNIITIPYSNDIQDGCLISSSSTYL